MRFYLEYINHLGRLQKKSAHRRLQEGFTITEVLLAGLMMLIAVLMAGNGLINLLRSNYRANADSEIQNNLNRTLEFVSDDVRRARIIAENENEIETTKVPDWNKIPGARAVLAFQIPDPNNPGNAPLTQQIVYYTADPQNSSTGPRVLWRHGPKLDDNGNYDITNWQQAIVTDMLAAAANNPICPPTFTRIPAKGDDFYTCVPAGGNQVILNANAQVKMTTNEEVKYSVTTRVFPRATCKISCLAGLGPSPFKLTYAGGATKPTLPILEVPATVKAEVIDPEGTCTFDENEINPENYCGVLAAPNKDLNKGKPEEAFGLGVPADAGDGIVVYVNGLRNVYEKPTQTVDVYTSKTGLPPDININPLTKNQILFVLTTKTTPPTSYQVLVTIEPQ
ncbi:hypothetical protein B1L04_12795 [Microcystis aeruginosa KW]|uniref:Prepilin-type N-terminal cleavage/methylation domain-containing protein n=1 Tax=Microcystis aeruginosa KW TaxID=1960155 RepID=A0A1V4BRZ6_MICAE|nr:hypothetical protein [Microcystis aeruginosa]OPF16979.1 hypothetical protein B1L04_12795 [Microcystis aeruginosa KW]